MFLVVLVLLAIVGCFFRSCSGDLPVCALPDGVLEELEDGSESSLADEADEALVMGGSLFADLDAGDDVLARVLGFDWDAVDDFGAGGVVACEAPVGRSWYLGGGGGHGLTRLCVVDLRTYLWLGVVIKVVLTRECVISPPAKLSPNSPPHLVLLWPTVFEIKDPGVGVPVEHLKVVFCEPDELAPSRPISPSSTTYKIRSSVRVHPIADEKHEQFPSLAVVESAGADIGPCPCWPPPPVAEAFGSVVDPVEDELGSMFSSEVSPLVS